MDAKILQNGYGFATYPSVKLKGYKLDPKTRKMKFVFLKELLFGDFIKLFIENGNAIEEVIGNKTFIRVRARNTNGFILASEILADRILEVNFIDVAQGDGCHIVTPTDSHYIIDAGKSDNMFRFLSWRFNLRYAKTSPPPFTAVITHSDEDHYAGFTQLFTRQKDWKNQFTFKTVYHNGLVEESGESLETLGMVVKHTEGDFITGLCDTDIEFTNRSISVSKPGNYIKLLKKTTAPKISLRYGNAPIYDDGIMKIEVLGPVSKTISNKEALPVFKSEKGKTKNGNSVILKISIGKVRILLGGDLNSEAESYLFKSFTNTDIDSLVDKIESKGTSEAERTSAISKLGSAIKEMRKYFEADIAKSCHHGSADFTSEFLQAINPIGTVISSGDEEPHCHPRPDTLGTIGKFSRGKRSLIFSTELARSGKEFIDLTKIAPGKLKERAVTVYGMINVRTDGEKLIVAQKLEVPRASANWDIHKLEWNTKLNGFEYKPD